MIYRNGLSNIIQKFLNNKEIIENYFFMTILQILNSLFYLLIYPFLIRTLGADSYGLYVFALSIITYFVTFVGYGFDLPAVKVIAQNVNDLKTKSYTISCIFTAKVYLVAISIIIFSLIIITIPFLRLNWIIFVICFIQIISGVLFPQWYFQGVQKMRIVTYIQLVFKIVSLPFIFLLLNNSTDLWIFALITTLASFGGAIVAAFIVRYNEKIEISWMSFKHVKLWFVNAFPFFLSSAASIIKEQSIAVIIGSFFGMKDVAIYDLANKLIIVPRTLLVSVNGALFPKIVKNIKTEQIKKIIRYETILGLLVILLIVFFGKWIVLLMGGVEMLDSYPLAIILSVTVLAWLVVGSYINFVFIPHNKYFYVSINQTIAFLSFFLYCIIGFFIIKSIFVLVISITLSGLTEIAFCKYLIKKKELL